MASRKNSSVPAAESGKKTDPSLDELYRRPGFLLRRAHQISVSIFLEESAALGITTTQYGALVVLNSLRELDQVGLAMLVGIDRSTTALVVSKLEVAGYLHRKSDRADKRRKLLVLTKSGRDVLKQLAEPAQRARARALAAFSVADQKLFLSLLEKFVTTFNADTRAPIRSRKSARRGKGSAASVVHTASG